MVKESFKERQERKIIEVCKTFIRTEGTLRSTAKLCGVSKSSVHKYVRDDIFYINRKLFVKCNELLKHNKRVRAMRGGMAYAKICSKKRADMVRTATEQN
ncbi:sporulation transcriptional regulator SpoIIID [Inconstantimicrobium porci]|uniref:sporulation transcriptional regulator SpoIIID n=1 Tax=Inconstantimicrobium porci TaxID=2652291 RepID=UPI0024098798|nr:sporulation transcriptional regulator SpoIIID [Inconstantimicrobium porci]MDD6769673.1 sporulation transcriptional regulator SpoIIID [Inconstantimicrobium porci]